MSAVTFWLVAALAGVGAVAVLVARETVRLVAGLGAFMLGMAGLYLFYAMPLLAAAQVFLYVGGVLVIFLFAIMALRPDDAERVRPVTRLKLVPVSVCAGLFAVLVTALRDVGAATSGIPVHQASVEAVGTFLLGKSLPAFELVGGLLLVALIAAVTILERGERR